MKYRKDIDGLRAFAVSTVLLFHLDFDLFSGGFTGVDIFFVISGYLISKIIYTQLQENRFSFKNFFVRRAKRLLPASLFTVGFTLALASYISPPLELVQTAKSSMASVFYLANIFFWKNSGYFELDSHLRPLLHMWSLSLEEQFYFFWPLLLFSSYFMVRRKKFSSDFKRMALIFSPLFGLGAIALSLSIYFIEKDPSAIFYLMPFRVHEFSLGALAALMELKKRPKLMNELGSLLGLGLVCYATFQFNAGMIFPGINSLIPAFGAFLLILCGHGSFISTFLEFKPLRLIGHISYSLYLVHWPMICLYKQHTLRPLSILEQLSVLIVCIIVSTLTYRFIETPFRKGRLSEWLTPSRTGHTILITTLTLSIPALFLIFTNGWPSRYGEEMKSIISVATDTSERTKFNGADDSCFIGDGSHVLPYKKEFNFDCLNVRHGQKNILILGDSFAAYSFWGLKTAFPDFHFLQSTMAGCLPTISDKVNTENCADRNQHMFNEFDYSEIDGVILMANWTLLSVSTLPESLSALQDRFPNLPIVILGPTPEFDHSIPLLFTHYKSIENTKSNLANHIFEEPFELDLLFKKTTLPEPTLYVSMTDLICKSRDSCKISTKENLPLFIDGHHLYYKSSHIIFSEISDEIKEFFEKGAQSAAP